MYTFISYFLFQIKKRREGINKKKCRWEKVFIPSEFSIFGKLKHKGQLIECRIIERVIRTQKRTKNNGMADGRSFSKILPDLWKKIRICRPIHSCVDNMDVTPTKNQGTIIVHILCSKSPPEKKETVSKRDENLSEKDFKTHFMVRVIKINISKWKWTDSITSRIRKSFNFSLLTRNRDHFKMNMKGLAWFI